MGAAIGKAAESIGGVVGNAVVAPFKNIFTGSCEGVCSGPWDLICFIENLCVTNLFKLFMILGLSYIINFTSINTLTALLFFYLVFKLGICQCIVKTLCRMCWAACAAYWFALEDMTCFLWHKLKNTKRVNRRRRPRQRDIETGHSSSRESESCSDDHHSISASRKKKSYREKRRNHSQRTLHHSTRHGKHHHGREMPVRVKVGSRRLKSFRQLQMRNLQRQTRISKRRKLR